MKPEADGHHSNLELEHMAYKDRLREMSDHAERI